MKEKFIKEWKETRVLFKSIPATTCTIFVLSVVMMNLLANKLIVDLPWVSLDAGFCVSWVGFLCNDMIVKRFGPKAATKVTIFAMLSNLLAVAIFNIAAILPGTWGVEENLAGASTQINATLAGSWQVLFASTVAFVSSGAINNVLNWHTRKLMNKCKNDFVKFSIASYVSTAIGQFCDNFIFALLFTIPVFGISWLSAIGFAAAGAFFELLCEIVFSPAGYKVSKKWEKEKVGEEYLKLVGKEC